MNTKFTSHFIHEMEQISPYLETIQNAEEDNGEENLEAFLHESDFRDDNVLTDIIDEAKPFFADESEFEEDFYEEESEDEMLDDFVEEQFWEDEFEDDDPNAINLVFDNLDREDFEDFEEEDFWDQEDGINSSGLFSAQTSADQKETAPETKKLFAKGVEFINEGGKENNRLGIIAIQRVFHHKGLNRIPKNFANIFFQLGRANKGLKRYATALFYYELSLENRPGNETLLKLRKEMRGKRELRRIPRKAGRSLRSKRRVNYQIKRLYNKGIYYVKKKRYIRAIYYFERSRQGLINNETDPSKSAPILRMIGKINFHIGRYAASIIYLNRYIKLKGTDTDIEKIIEKAKFALGIDE